MSRRKRRATLHWARLLVMGLAGTIGCGRAAEPPRAMRPLGHTPPASHEPAYFAGSEVVRLVPQADDPHAAKSTDVAASPDHTFTPDTDESNPPVIRLPVSAMESTVATGPITPPIVMPVSTSHLPRSEPSVRSMPKPTQTTPTLESSIPGVRSSRMTAVVNQAQQHHDHGVSLANRAAYFSAREEFLETARILVRGLDADEGGTRHAKALTAGLQALAEAEDFVTHPTETSERSSQLADFIASHDTPVLHDTDVSTMNSAAMAQTYYTFAVDQLVFAVGHEPAGSRVLHSLGKLYGVLAKDPASNIVAAEAKAAVLHHAALLVDPRNSQAANELAVLSAAQGRYQESRDLLLRSLASKPEAAVWHNLATVHARLGDAELAQRARVAAVQAAGGGDPTDLERWAAQQAIQWFPPATFAATSETPSTPASTTATTTTAPPVMNSQPAVAPQATKPLARLLPWREDNVWTQRAHHQQTGDRDDQVHRTNWMHQ